MIPLKTTWSVSSRRSIPTCTTTPSLHLPAWSSSPRTGLGAGKIVNLIRSREGSKSSRSFYAPTVRGHSMLGRLRTMPRPQHGSQAGSRDAISFLSTRELACSTPPCGCSLPPSSFICQLRGSERNNKGDTPLPVVRRSDSQSTMEELLNLTSMPPKKDGKTACKMATLSYLNVSSPAQISRSTWWMERGLYP